MIALWVSLTEACWTQWETEMVLAERGGKCCIVGGVSVGLGNIISASLTSGGCVVEPG